VNILGIALSKNIKEAFMDDFVGDYDFIDTARNIESHLQSKKYSGVILDVGAKPHDKVMNLIKEIYKKQKGVIIVVGEKANLEFIAGSIKAGAYDYLLKPIEPRKLVKITEKALRDRKMRAEKVEKLDSPKGAVIGHTKEMVEVYKLIGKFATNTMTVLISGEKGTGKKAVGKAIHKFSKLSSEPFVSVNCTAFQNEFLERKLFGVENREQEIEQKGVLEQSSGGTLHLGNIESMSLELQAKLLGLLQENAFFRIGGREIIKTNVRIIASSSENLEELIVNGKFIEELYQRLRILEIDIPALRERKDDIPLLTDFFISRYNDDLNKNVKGISKPAMKKIMRYDWPGNIRELKNTIKSAMALCRGNSILVEDLPANVIGAKITKRRGDIQDWILADWIEGEISILQSNSSNDYYGNIISRVERELIRQVLEQTNGKKVEAAEILGITRNTLRTKMNNYGLE